MENNNLDAVKRLGFGTAFPISSNQLRVAMLEYAGGAPMAVAADRAGIPVKTFKKFTQRDTFAKDLRAVVQGLVETVYAPRCFAFLFETVNDAAIPARVRVDSAKIILDRSGYTAGPLPAGRDPADLTLMSRDELHKFVQEAEARLASQAADVTPANGAAGAAPPKAGPPEAL